MTDMLDRLVPDAYPYVRGKIRLSAGEGELVLDCGDFGDGAVVLELIDRYLERFPGADRRAALSLWTMYYFSHLVIGPLLFWLRERRIMPMAMADARLRVDGQTGAPAGFLVKTEGEIRADFTVFEAMRHAIRDHAEPVIEAIATTGKVSPKLLWNNLAVYADWAIREFGGEDTALRDQALDVIACEAWPDGWKNPMAGQLRRENDAEGACFTRRKICCLRYLLPGVPGCGMVCPLPAGRE